MKEGLDRLAAEQAQAGRSADLFDVVQRFLEDGQTQEPSEDLLSRAARALEEIDSKAPVVEEQAKSELPEEMPDISADREILQAMWPSEAELPPEPVTFQEPLDFEIAEAEVEGAEVPEAASEVAAEEPGLVDLTKGEELPEVITADMLRARKNLNVDMDSFEIPAELLAGLDEEEWEDEEEEEEIPAKKGKTKVRAKPKKAVKPEARPKAKKRRRTFGDEDERYF